jgi:hypothetical protein
MGDVRYGMCDENPAGAALAANDVGCVMCDGLGISKGEEHHQMVLMDRRFCRVSSFVIMGTRR